MNVGLKSIGLLVAAIVLIYGLNQWGNGYYYDATSYKSHHLSQTTTDLLKNLPQTLEIELYTLNPDLERDIRFFIESIRPHANIQFTVHHQIISPKKKQLYGFATDGLIMRLGEQTQSINLKNSPFDERLLVQNLFQLSRTAGQWIAFLSGHQEPLLTDTSPEGYSLLAKALTQQGFNILHLNLPETGFIAQNTSLLVITSPKTHYLPKEIELIENYLNKGGALLWLMDFLGQPLNFLTETLGVKARPGVIVDPKGYQMGTPHPAITIITQYPQGSLFANNQLTAYPWAQALTGEPKKDFKKQLLLKTNKESWTHVGSLEGAIEFTPTQGDTKGPLDVGYKLTRVLPDNQEQSIIVIGNHRFASNAAIQNYGNLTVIMNAINTLVNEPILAQLQYDTMPDVVAHIPKGYLYLMYLGLILGLPGMLLGIGLIIYLKQRNLTSCPRIRLI